MRTLLISIPVLTLLIVCEMAGAAPPELEKIWEFPTPKSLPQALICDREGQPWLYAAMKNGGLAVLDISNPKLPPKETATLSINQFGNLDVMQLMQVKDHLYLALGDFFNAKGSPAGLGIVNITNPRKPTVVGFWKSDEVLQGSAAVIVQGKYAFLGGMHHGIFIFDVSNPKNPKKISTIVPDLDYPVKNPKKVQLPNARGFALKGNDLFVAFDAGGLRIIDVSTPAKPKETGRYINSGMGKKQQAFNNLVIDGNIAYVAVDYAGLEVLDIRNPQDIKQLAWWNPWEAHTLKNLWLNSQGHTNQIELDPKSKRIYLSAGDSDLLVIDVSTPTRPKWVGRFGEPGDKLGVWGLTSSKDNIYLAYINAVVPFQGTWSGIKAIKK